MSATTCPGEYDLQQLLDDRLVPQRLEEIRRHLGECESCRNRLEARVDSVELEHSRALFSESHTSLHDDTTAEFSSLREILIHQWLGSESLTETADEMDLLGPPQQADDIGTLERYRVVRVLGTGGMGTVFLAIDPELNRRVAIKVLRRDRHDEESRQRFVREARAAALLQHDHVVTVHAVANPVNAAPHIVMQFIDGVSLREQIAEQGPLPAREAARIAAEIARGLATAHAAGMIHRDVKPANIMLNRDDGRARILDFGLVRETATSDGLTDDGACLGTPEYMSPEQVTTPSQVDERTDVYGLGMTLYESLTGTVPFRGTAHQVMQQLLHDPPASPGKLNAAVSRDLETICLKAIEKDAVRRYQTATELADDLDRWLRGEPILARSVGWLGRLRRWQRRKPALANLAAALLLLVVVGFAAVSWQWRRAESNLAEANWQRQQAERHLADALRHQAVRRSSEAKASQMTARADKAQGQLLSVVLQSQLHQDTNPVTVKQRFLQQIQGISHDAMEQFRGRATGQRQLAGTYLAEGNLYRELGQHQQSLAAYTTALRMFRAMLRDKPDSTEAKQAIASTLQGLGKLHAERGATKSALTCHREAAGILRGLIHDNPQAHNFPLDLVRVRITIGSLLMATDRNKALLSLQRARQQLLALQQSAGKTFDIMTRRGVIAAYRDLGDAHKTAGQIDESLALCRIACHLGQELLAESPRYLGGHAELAVTLNHLGESLLQANHLQEAVACFRNAVAQQEAMPNVRNFLQPNPQVQHDLYLANLSRALRLTGEFRESISASRRRQAVAAWDPEVYYSSAGEIARCLSDLAEWSAVPDDIDIEETRELVVDSLRKAIDHGFRDKKRLSANVALRRLLEERPELPQLLAMVPRNPPPAPKFEQIRRPVKKSNNAKRSTRSNKRRRGQAFVRMRTFAGEPRNIRQRAGFVRRVALPDKTKRRRQAKGE